MFFVDGWDSESDSESDSAPNVSISSKTEYSSPYKGISNDIINTLFGNIVLPAILSQCLIQVDLRSPI